MTIRTSDLPNLTVARFYSLRDQFEFTPAYQREGNVWNTETKQLFIDSIINGFLIPRIYIEQTARKKENSIESDKPWAVLDGKQRLLTILEFIDGDLKLANDFVFFEDADEKSLTSEDGPQGKSLEDLRRNYPHIASKFDTFTIPAVIIETTSTDEIEEMFERLNSASSLNAAERRNAISCPMRTYTNLLSEHSFFINKCPIKNARFKYRELASKLLTIELQYRRDHKLHDLKSKTLMEAFVSSKQNKEGYTEEAICEYYSHASSTLDRMSTIFDDSDALLRSIGSFIVYYLFFRSNEVVTISRVDIEQFEDNRRYYARSDYISSEEEESSEARYYRLYNAWVQSSNDGTALEGRLRILSAYLSNPTENWFQSLENPDKAISFDASSLTDTNSRPYDLD